MHDIDLDFKFAQDLTGLEDVLTLQGWSY
jgi:hypothetical protein